MSTLIKNIAKIKSNEKIDLKEARRRILPLLEAIQKVAEISPAGLYLNWPEFSVDGKPMIDYLAPIISSIRDNGYGAVFYVMEKVGGMIEKISKIGRQ